MKAIGNRDLIADLHRPVAAKADHVAVRQAHQVHLLVQIQEDDKKLRIGDSDYPLYNIITEF